MQKGFGVIYILVGVLILALVASGAYYFGKQTSTSKTQNPVDTSQTPQPSSVPNSIDETANEQALSYGNWKTYTNTKYGFSFKYPTWGNWEFRELKNPITGEDATFSAQCGWAGQAGDQGCTDSDNINFFTVNLSKYKSIEEYKQDTSKNTSENLAVTDSQIVYINGIQAIKSVNPGICNPGADSCQTSSIEYFLMRNNQGFLIVEWFRNITHETKLINFPKPYPDILSTFKFTN